MESSIRIFALVAGVVLVISGAVLLVAPVFGNPRSPGTVVLIGTACLLSGASVIFGGFRLARRFTDAEHGSRGTGVRRSVTRAQAVGSLGGVALILVAIVVVALAFPISVSHAGSVVFGALLALWLLVRASAALRRRRPPT